MRKNLANILVFQMNNKVMQAYIENEEGMSEDEITAQDLICILKERCGNEWQKQLHLLCRCHTFFGIFTDIFLFFSGSKELTNEDIDNVSAFALWINSSAGLSHKTFN